jgi:ribonucleoside-diphosphate reductase beta chain
MPGLCDSNVFISRDEAMHADFAIHLINNHIVKNHLKKIREIFLSALVIEKNLLLSHYL